MSDRPFFWSDECVRLLNLLWQVEPASDIAARIGTPRNAGRPKPVSP